ncbi:MAG: hypothetical protein WD361_01245 [Gracilimonas sp.]
MSKASSSETYLSKYKELIITTIICLFLTGIYDSINNQTAEIKRWYELMINIQAEQRIQGVDLELIKESIETFQIQTNHELDNHQQRIQSLERGDY